MKRITTLIALSIVAALALGACGGTTKTKTVTVPAVTTTAPVAPKPTPKPKPTGPATTFAGTGTSLVGQDIRPGTYRAAASSGCYWEREKNPVGSTDSILANDNADGPVVVEILPSDAAFMARDCGDFHRIGSAATASAQPASAPATVEPQPVAPSSQGCGAGLQVNGNTSCPFAQNVQQAYSSQVGQGDGVVTAYSPVTGQAYAMNCTQGDSHVCTGGNDAYVAW
jgi:hypothetical protein